MAVTMGSILTGAGLFMQRLSVFWTELYSESLLVSFSTHYGCIENSKLSRKRNPVSI